MSASHQISSPSAPVGLVSPADRTPGKGSRIYAALDAKCPGSADMSIAERARQLQYPYDLTCHGHCGWVIGIELSRNREFCEIFN